MNTRTWMIIGELIGLGLSVFIFTKWIERPKRWKHVVALVAGVYASLSIIVHAGLLILWIIGG